MLDVRHGARPAPVPYRLAVVGGGPRATYVVERLSAWLAAEPAPAGLDVHLFERTGEFGAGAVHSAHQPRSSVLNRLAGEVGFAADEAMPDAGPLRPAGERPTLHEWCRQHHAATGDPEYDLGADDWPLRHQHGRALQHAFGTYLTALRALPGVRARLWKGEVVDLRRTQRDGSTGYRVLTAAGGTCDVDEVLLVTGHSANDPRTDPRTRRLVDFAVDHGCRYEPFAYPLERSLVPATVPPGAVVGLHGLGLTAIDQALYLTQGRGGEFTRAADGELVYRPCGREPSVVAFSHSGLLPLTRPQQTRAPWPEEHEGLVLTAAAIDQLRAARTAVDGAGQLDFDQHVLPLVVLEMALTFYATAFGDPVRDRLLSVVLPEVRAHRTGSPAAAPGQRPDRLLGTVDQDVDRLLSAVTGLVDGRLGADEAERRWPGAGAAARRWAHVVHDAALAAGAEGLVQLRELSDRPSRWLLPGRPDDLRFTWERATDPLHIHLPPLDLQDPGAYTAAYLVHLERDVRWAQQGTADNPHKAAADGVWRDLRHVICYAVEGAGLTADAHARFLRHHVRLHNRLVNGAAPEVTERVRALIAAGVLDVAAGPAATVVGSVTEPTGPAFVVRGPVTGHRRTVDVLVDGRVHDFHAAHDVRPLYPNLLRRGLVRLWLAQTPGAPDFVPGYLDLDAAFHPRDADGRRDERITVLGPAAAARNFFQFSALRPQRDHVVMRELLVWLRGWRQRVDATTRSSDADQVQA